MGSLAWPKRWAMRACCPKRTSLLSKARSPPSSSRDAATRPSSPGPLRRRAQLRGAAARRAHGDAGRRLHTGRSRNEQVSLDLRLYLKRASRCCDGQRGPLSWPPAPTGRGRRRRVDAGLHICAAPSPCWSRTSSCRTRPRFGRDTRPVAAAADEADALTLGSGAVAGTSYAVDTNALAARLGFSRVVANSIGRVERRRLRGVVPVRGVADDGAPESAWRRTSSSSLARNTASSISPSVGDRQQHMPQKKKS